MQVAQEAGYVITEKEAWSPRAPDDPPPIAPEYRHWCRERGRPFILIKTWNTRFVDILVDLGPMGPSGQSLDEGPLLARLRAASACGRVTPNAGYGEPSEGRCWRAWSIPAEQATTVAEELFRLAAGRSSAVPDPPARLATSGTGV
jgi:hypothetical protein